MPPRRPAQSAGGSRGRPCGKCGHALQGELTGAAAFVRVLRYVRSQTAVPIRRFLRMVQPARAARRAGRLRPRPRLHDRAPVRLGPVGEHPAGARSPLQGDRPLQRRVPAADSPQFHRQGALPRRGLLPRTGGRHNRRGRGVAGAPGHSADVRNHHWARLREVDPVLPRSACPDQPVEQRRALGAAHQTVSAHAGVLLAGRAHCPRHVRRGRGRNPSDARHLRRLRPKRSCGPRHPGSQDGVRALRRRGPDVFDRGDDGGWQGAAGRDLAQSRAKFREGLRDTVPRPPGGAAVLLDDVLGPVDALHRGDHHGPRRRPGPDLTAPAGPHPDRRGPHLQDRRGEEPSCSRPVTKSAAPSSPPG